MQKLIAIYKRNKVYCIIGLVSAIILALTLIFGDNSPHLTGNVVKIDTIANATYDEAALRKQQPTTQSGIFNFFPVNNDNNYDQSNVNSYDSNNSSAVSGNNSGTQQTDSYHFVMSNDNVHVNPNLDSIIKRLADDLKNQTTVPATTKKDKDKDKDQTPTKSRSESEAEATEPQEEEDKTLTCTISISCATALSNKDKLDEDKAELIPSDGWILKPVTVEFTKGEDLGEVMNRVCRENGIHFEYTFNPLYDSNYAEGIGNLYEFDCGSESGWMYSVNGWYPNYGYSRYELKNNDNVEWKYTCSLGKDIGGSNY